MKYLLTLTLCALFLFGTSQISQPTKLPPTVTIGKIAPLGSFVAELAYQVNNGDTAYTLSFNDASYTQINSIENVRFAGGENTVNELHKAFKSVFLSENKKNKDYIVHFTLGKDVVAISNTKSMGITSAMFLVRQAYFTLTEKQVDKLFGKN